MTQYSYDESGGIFNFFMLTLLTVFLIPYTWVWATSSRTRKRSYRWILVAVGWILFVLFVYRVATTSIEEKHWDPYQILGVDQNADESAVKKAFKRLSLINHPDKADANDTEAASRFIDITKAYKVLTDEEVRKVYDETGHPDGRQAFQLGLALPKWLVEKGNSTFVLLVYGLLFGIGLPTLVARWWSSAKSMTKAQILNQTMAIFYRDLKDGLGFKILVDILTRAQEFNEIVSLDRSDALVDDLTEKVKNAMETNTSDRFEKKKKDATNMLQQRVQLLLFAHLLRVHVSDPDLAQEIKDVAEKAAQLTKGMLQITSSRNWMQVSISIIELNQYIMQALYLNQSCLLQLPHLNNEILKHFRTKKRNVASIAQLLALSSEESLNLLKSLEPAQREDVFRVAKTYPSLKVITASFAVEGELAVIPSAIVTLTVKLHGVYGNDPDLVLKDNGEGDEEGGEQSKWWVDSSANQKNAVLPQFPTPRKPVTWVMLANAAQGRMICLSKVVGLDGLRVAKLKFQAPPNEGSWTFQLFIKSDTYLGIDQMQDIKLVVQPESAAPLEDEPDDISEPEDHIVPSAPSPKKVKPAAERGEYDDSSDSDDDPAPKRRASPSRGGHVHGDSCNH